MDAESFFEPFCPTIFCLYSLICSFGNTKVKSTYAKESEATAKKLICEMIGIGIKENIPKATVVVKNP